MIYQIKASLKNIYVHVENLLFKSHKISKEVNKYKSIKLLLGQLFNRAFWLIRMEH